MAFAKLSCGPCCQPEMSPDIQLSVSVKLVAGVILRLPTTQMSASCDDIVIPFAVVAAEVP